MNANVILRSVLKALPTSILSHTTRRFRNEVNVHRHRENIPETSNTNWPHQTPKHNSFIEIRPNRNSTTPAASATTSKCIRLLCVKNALKSMPMFPHKSSIQIRWLLSCGNKPQRSEWMGEGKNMRKKYGKNRRYSTHSVAPPPPPPTFRIIC